MNIKHVKVVGKSPEPIKIKNPEIPVLSDISKPPKEDFWDFFPSNCSISGETSINTVLLRSKLEKVRHKLTNAQKRRGLKAVMSGVISSPDS